MITLEHTSRRYISFCRRVKEEGIDNEEFRRRCTVARILLNKGFSKRQIVSMSLFITFGKTEKDILKLFAPKDSVDVIENFINLI